MSQTFRGIGVSPGAAVGPAHVIRDVPAELRPGRAADEEIQALDAAVEQTVRQLEELGQRLEAEGHAAEAGIMDAQALMARDPGFLESIRDGIASGKSAASAVEEAGAQFRALFESLEDPYLAARAADVQDVAGRLVRNLAGEGERSLERPSIVVAHDLTPSQTASLDRSLVLGLATDVGSTTSHTAILARALGIPAVTGLGDVTRSIADGEEIALDGSAGTVIVAPSDGEKREYLARARVEHVEQERLRALSSLPAETADGFRVILAANIGSPDDLESAVGAGAEGVGLFRTEFLFAGRAEMPSEDEQAEAYCTVLSAMAPHTVVIRTLDVGGDKPLPYLPQASEMNPFLGERGIRYTLAHRDVFRGQLRALLRASSSGSLAIMLPMVSHVREIEETRSLLAGLQREVGGSAELGIMVEVPAAALSAGALARHASFFSVGTNDLVQYALAVDRTNDRVATLYRPLHPGILRLLKMTADAAHAHGRWAGVCGEMAGDLPAIPILIGLGFDELSMTPSRIPAARDRIRRLHAATCRELAEQALACETADAVERLVEASAVG